MKYKSRIIMSKTAINIFLWKGMNCLYCRIDTDNHEYTKASYQIGTKKRKVNPEKAFEFISKQIDGATVEVKRAVL